MLFDDDFELLIIVAEPVIFGYRVCKKYQVLQQLLVIAYAWN